MKTNITIVIKTFERPYNLRRLLASLHKYHPEYPIVIVDDSALPSAQLIEKWQSVLTITYLHIPFDIGLSAGRNRAVKQIKTKYFLLCDDDFIFEKTTDPLVLLSTLIKYDVDLVAGGLYEAKDFGNPLANFLIRKFYVIKLSLGFSLRFPIKKILYGDLIQENRVLKLELDKKLLAQDIITSDIGFNFFLAKTNICEHVTWREELKLLEHLVFFHDFKKAGLSMVVNTTVCVNHLRDMDINYRKFRYSENNVLYEKIRLNILNIDEYIPANPIITKVT